MIFASLVKPPRARRKFPPTCWIKLSQRIFKIFSSSELLKKKTKKEFLQEMAVFEGISSAQKLPGKRLGYFGDYCFPEFGICVGIIVSQQLICDYYC